MSHSFVFIRVWEREAIEMPLQQHTKKIQGLAHRAQKLNHKQNKTP